MKINFLNFFSIHFVPTAGHTKIQPRRVCDVWLNTIVLAHSDPENYRSPWVYEGGHTNWLTDRELWYRRNSLMIMYEIRFTLAQAFSLKYKSEVLSFIYCYQKVKHQVFFKDQTMNFESFIGLLNFFSETVAISILVLIYRYVTLLKRHLNTQNTHYIHK